MTKWNPSHYLQFDSERTRAAVDLCQRIQLDQPRHIVDLGCGPGNSTQILRIRWPESHLAGIDNSPEMLATAKRLSLNCEWVLADLAQWVPATEVDLIYSNAALQWLPDQESLLQRLWSFLSSKGSLAFQIPSNEFPLVRKLIYDISEQPEWRDRLAGARNSLSRHPPAFYYDLLCKQASHIDIWETEYYHVLASPASIIDWISGTGLRPFLAGLTTDTERAAFLSELSRLTELNYQTRPDGKVLFPFRRIFVIAYR